MNRRMSLRWCAASLVCLVPALACAHSFSMPYILPIPFWIYVYGCAATLIVTFAVLGVFASNPVSPAVDEQGRTPAPAKVFRVPQWLLAVLRAGALGCLVLCILAGFIGTPDAGRNINYSLFWVVFLLGFAYLIAFVGDLYALINPWQTCVELLERVGIDLSTARVAYPKRLGYWPAFVFYLALIWVELFTEPVPRSLAIVLSVYSAITLIGVALFGKAAWFTQADFFSNYFRLIGKVAPVEYLVVPGDQVRLRLRAPFVGLLRDPPAHISIVLLVLGMLSSTSYDAIYDTQYWTALFWKNALWMLQPLWGADLGKAQTLLMSSFLVYRKVGLLIFPFLYLAVYLLALFAARLMARAGVETKTLALAFCYSLLPIAFAYNFAHYYTFVVSQLHTFPWLMSDPFGRGWNLLALAQDVQSPTLQMGVIWHTQVVVILIGHIASVAVAHRVAILTFSSRRQVISSQLPLLLLMVAYTMLGLWILTLPLA